MLSPDDLRRCATIVKPDETLILRFRPGTSIADRQAMYNRIVEFNVQHPGQPLRVLLVESYVEVATQKLEESDG